MKTLYDKQVEDILRNEGKFRCPPIFQEGLNRYQMTCDDCPDHIEKLCQEALEIVREEKTK